METLSEQMIKPKALECWLFYKQKNFKNAQLLGMN